MRYPVVLLDVGGTLIGPRGSFGEVYAEVFSEFGVRCDSERFNTAVYATWDEMNRSIPTGTDRYAHFDDGEHGYWRRFAQRAVELATGELIGDRLAAAGLKLTRAYVPLPQCSPARASMFTGRYPHQHQMLRVGDGVEFPEEWQAEVGPLASRTPLPQSVPSLGQAFKAAGYRMGYTGPWHMGGDETPHHGWTDFWRTYRYWKDGRDFYVQHLERHGWAETFHEEHRHYGSAGAIERGTFPSGASTIPVEHARTHWAVDQAIEFIESRDRRPWMFCCSIKDPHPPFISPGGFAELVSPDEIELPLSNADDLSTKPRTLRESVQHQWVRNMAEAYWRRLIAHYYGLVEMADHHVGRVIEALRIFGARHQGQLPERLEDITDLPVPSDPVTGRSFIYLRDGETAILRGPALRDIPLNYEIEMVGSQ